MIVICDCVIPTGSVSLGLSETADLRLETQTQTHFEFLANGKFLFQNVESFIL